MAAAIRPATSLLIVYPSTSVGFRHRHRIDHQHIDQFAPSRQLQTKLFFHQREERAGGLSADSGSAQRTRSNHLEVALQARFVHHGAVDGSGNTPGWRSEG